VLDRQVAQAKAEAEAAAQEAAAEEAASPFRAPVHKSIVFTIDASYSMNQGFGRNQGDHYQLTRMDSARVNLLSILDEHVEDGDSISVITFANDVRTDVPATIVTPHNRLQLREKAERACRARGATAFYDALVASAEMLDRHATSNNEGQPRWIIALTDGEDNRSRKSVHETVRVLRRSKSAPDLLIIGVQLLDETKPHMEQLAATTENSKFIDASGGMDSLNDAFEEVAELIAE
jgi:Mg-chelatase subunit ChlD